ncbi:hypothetical protein [Luteipulveratus mongoliensis]|uniref:Uncharacterized protein n=1 Tax=Luteipulveratus mongoliensis TaxID=571913 RepID=A0A0K1JJL7_9MICO|nr:hypothetical protein [Luteipulveratus mongoliensis]AKU16773.1 hypothetical protein VV02_14340 [Luteipulveratus mongoliensis]
MPPDALETRTIISPRLGTRITTVVALVLLAGAVYWFFTPITLTGSSGAQFGCGSAKSPPSDAFPKNVCGDLPKVHEFRSVAFLVAGILIGLLGAVMFGFERRTQTRAARPSSAEESPTP